MAKNTNQKITNPSVSLTSEIVFRAIGRLFKMLIFNEAPLRQYRPKLYTNIGHRSQKKQRLMARRANRV